MIRTLVYLILVAAVAAAAAWLADRPGSVSLVWQGWRVDTSVGALLLAVAVVAVIAALVYRMWGLLTRVPARVAHFRDDRRRERGYRALSQGMAAVAAGDAGEASRLARRADTLLNDPPLTLLLSAQAAQMNGDDAAAERYFTAMLRAPETAFLGLRGLLNQALRRGDAEAALDFARRAHALRPRTPWVLTTLFDLESRTGRWDEAEATLREATRRRRIGRDEGRRRRAIVLYERSLQAEAEGRGGAALDLVRKAHRLEPGFVPAAVRLATLLVRARRFQAATRALERTWSRAPHPDLAEAYAEVRSDEDALARVRRFERLLQLRPDHPESQVALARAALAAKLWGKARRHLQAAGEPASSRVCRLMAELEEGENGDAAAAREWLARVAEAEPDPAWVCGECGNAIRHWAAFCGKCGAFDTLSWRTPPRVEPLTLEAPAAAPALTRAAEARPEAPNTVRPAG